MRRMLVGSGNPKKKREIIELLSGLSLEILSPKDLNPTPPVPDETGASFEANAAEKALAYAEETGLLTLADDSGLTVDALDGRPGIYSARFAGPSATDSDNNQKLIAELAQVPSAERGAGYVCALALALPGKILLEAKGTCRGIILKQPRGEGGFGYDPYFFVPSLERSFAELSPEEKAEFSHRGEALRELRKHLPKVLSHLSESAQEPPFENPS